MSTYNGWTNWDTWEAFNWLTNDYDLHKKFEACADADEVAELWKYNCPTHDVVFSEINWQEIAATLDN